MNAPGTPSICASDMKNASRTSRRASSFGLSRPYLAAAYSSLTLFQFTTDQNDFR